MNSREEEQLLDEIHSCNKKVDLKILNKKKLSDEDLEELFVEI